MTPTVAIIGRPNVGKSTLFNRLLRQNKALTHDRPGVTRDRLYGKVRWGDRHFDVIDTGGLIIDESNSIEKEILGQANEAIDEADLILFVVDGREGLTGLDQRIAELLRQSGRPILMAVNKVDGPDREAADTAEFHALGFPLLAVSASHGWHAGELADEIETLLPEMKDTGEEEAVETDKRGLRLALLGRPNAGKSSMVNALIGENRLIVSPEAGTTRDAIDVTIEKGGKRYTFVDTAGVRRRSKIDDSLERFSVLRSLKSSKSADVTVLVLDVLEGLTGQDMKLLDFLVQEKTPFIVAVNKIDLVARPRMTEMKEAFRKELKLCPYAPLVYTSTVTRAGLASILPLAERLHAETQIRVGTGQLNRAMREAIDRHQPPLVKNRRAKFYYLTQAQTDPPTFVFFVNDEALVKTSYARYLESSLRKLFNLKMTPIKVAFRSSHKDKEEK